MVDSNERASKTEVIIHTVVTSKLIEGWELLVAVLAMIFLAVLPFCFNQWSRIPCLHKFFVTKLHVYYTCVCLFNIVFFTIVLSLLKDWTFNECFFTALAIFSGILDNLYDTIMAAFYILIGLAVWRQRDRILQFLGIDRAVFRTDWRDCITCFSMARFRPIEIQVWKAQDLPVGGLVRSNLYVEFRLGFNEPATTRVHRDVSSDVIFNESVQLNFDDADDTDNLRVTIFHQDLVASSEMAKVSLSVPQVLKLEEVTGLRSGETFQFSHEHFQAVDLIPRGRVWLRIAPIVDELQDTQFDEESGFLCCCCNDYKPSEEELRIENSTIMGSEMGTMGP